MRLARGAAALLIALVCAAGREMPDTDLIHADLPLWTGAAAAEAAWPRPFVDKDSFGCVHNIKLGDWRLDGYRGMDEWIRFENYGVNHCALIERRSYNQDQLGGRAAIYSHIVSLGETTGRDGSVHLWALQSGLFPGSSYTLLARKRSGGTIAAFEVLQVECPKDKVRETAPLDIFRTRYCAINSRAELVDLARKMARRAPAARMEFVAHAPD